MDAKGGGMTIEGLGEAVTGGLIARAVEPEAGETSGEHHGTCLNCGAPLNGSYCHACGQKGHVHRTVRGFGHDLLHSVFHFEGKIWRTLPMLAWRPGELTRRYVRGERARFVSPIAIFLFSVFLMFAVFSLVGGPMDFSSSDRTPAEARAELEADFQRAQTRDRTRLARLQAQRRQLTDAEEIAEVEGDLRELQQESRAEEQVYRQALAVIATRERREASKAGETKGGGTEASAVTTTGDDVTSDIPGLDRAWRHAKENPELLAYKLQSNGYKFSWALIPISVPFVWLLFLHRRRYRQYKAYDHIVFVTYSIAFMSLLFILLSLLRPLVGQGTAALAILLVPPIHIYRQLRGAYELSRWSAIWRTFMLIMFAFTAGVLFFMLLVALGAMG